MEKKERKKLKFLIRAEKSDMAGCKAREMAARSRFKRRGHKKKYAAEE
jgi:hypothetical protein